MDSIPYYIVLGFLLLLGLVDMLDPKSIYNEMPKFYRKMQGLMWGIDSENPPKGFFTLFRIFGGLLFTISLIGILSILTGHLVIYK